MFVRICTYTRFCMWVVVLSVPECLMIRLTQVCLFYDLFDVARKMWIFDFTVRQSAIWYSAYGCVISKVTLAFYFECFLFAHFMENLFYFQHFVPPTLCRQRLISFAGRMTCVSLTFYMQRRRSVPFDVSIKIQYGSAIGLHFVDSLSASAVRFEQIIQTAQHIWKDGFALTTRNLQFTCGVNSGTALVVLWSPEEMCF